MFTLISKEFEADQCTSASRPIPAHQGDFCALINGFLKACNGLTIIFKLSTNFLSTVLDL